MNTLAEKIVELRIATRNATMCENVDGKTKNTLSIKSKILFLIKDKPLPPLDIILALNIAKTNLATLTKIMEQEGLLIRNKTALDGRAVVYEISDKGRAYLDKRLNSIEESFAGRFTPTEYDEAIDKLDESLSILSFIL